MLERVAVSLSLVLIFTSKQLPGENKMHFHTLFPALLLATSTSATAITNPALEKRAAYSCCFQVSAFLSPLS